MDSLIKELEEFFYKENNLYISLRFNQGVNEESLEELLTLLDRIGHELKGKTLINKRLAFLLSGVVTGIVGQLGQYRSQVEIDKIGYAIDKIERKVQEILS